MPYKSHQDLSNFFSSPVNHCSGSTAAAYCQQHHPQKHITAISCFRSVACDGVGVRVGLSRSARMIWLCRLFRSARVVRLRRVSLVPCCRDFNFRTFISANLAFLVPASLFISSSFPVHNPPEAVRCDFGLISTGTFFPVIFIIEFPFVTIDMRMFRRCICFHVPAIIYSQCAGYFTGSKKKRIARLTV